MSRHVDSSVEKEPLVGEPLTAPDGGGFSQIDKNVHGPFFCGRFPFVVLLVLGMIGTFATGFLTYRHVLLEGHSGQVGQSFLCHASGRINCDAILLTEYSNLFGYISSAALGLSGFIFVLWCSIGAAFNERMRKVAWVMLVAYFFAAVGFSWYYVYIMMFEVDFICTWCIVVHVINFTSLILVIGFSVKHKKDFLLKEIAPLAERIFFIVGAIAVPALVFLGAGLIEKSLKFDDLKVQFEELANDTSVIMAIIKNSATYDIAVSSSDPVFGSPQAPFSIIFFSDFQCPACAKTEKILKDVVRKNPQTLKLIYKNYPLSKKCNAGIVASGDLHPMACEAARAAYAAFLMKGSKGFWAYGDLLFEHQKQLKKNPWTKFAEKLNLDSKKFDELMKPDGPSAKKVEEDVKLGLGLQLTGTPKLFVEGKLIPENVLGGYFIEVLEELIKSKHPEQKNFTLNRL